MPHASLRLQTFPGYARPDGNGEWSLQFRARVSRASTKPLEERMIVRMIRRMVDASEFSCESELFQERIRDFVSRPIRGAKFFAAVDGRSLPMSGITRRNGLATLRCKLNGNDISQLGSTSNCIRLPITCDVTSATVTAELQRVQPAGLSVISDIDDTLKETVITDRRQMLINTFWRDFLLLEGVKQRLAEWRQQGADFHYVSNSPWQLCNALSAFFRQEKLPEGSFHLREFRLRDHVFRPVRRLRRSSKEVAIRRLIENFPRRQFAFLGDSCDRDPEVYGELAREFPRQLAGIWIRDVDDRPVDDDRLAKAFADVDADNWHVYRHSRELPARIGKHPATQPALR